MSKLDDLRRMREARLTGSSVVPRVSRPEPVGRLAPAVAITPQPATPTVAAETGHKTVVVTGIKAVGEDGKFDRKAYIRKYMKDYRARKKAKKDAPK